MPIVRGSKCAGEVTIAPVLIQQVFPSVVERLLECSDSSILQVRGRLVCVCVRACVCVCARVCVCVCACVTRT